MKTKNINYELNFFVKLAMKRKTKENLILSQ